MSVFLVKDGVVAQVWHDVQTLADFSNKYDDQPSDLHEGDAAPGMRWDGQSLTQPMRTHADQRTEALACLDEEHADYLVTLTGGAKQAERDTWPSKEEAARAFEAGTATPGQTAMLTRIAQGRGIPVADYAALVIAKAERTHDIIGFTDGLCSEAYAAILAATEDTVPLDEVAGRIEAVFTQLSAQMAAKVAELDGTGEPPEE